jgi:hypothetical protein
MHSGRALQQLCVPYQEAVLQAEKKADEKALKFGQVIKTFFTTNESRC